MAKLIAGPARKRERLVAVITRILNIATAGSDKDVKEWTSRIDDMLACALDNDAFGTEGQSDPRGDQRNGHFSMSNVEGIDT